MFLFRNLGPGFEAITVIVCFGNVAAVAKSVEPCSGYFGTPNTLAHSLKARLGVRITLVRS